MQKVFYQSQVSNGHVTHPQYQVCSSANVPSAFIVNFPDNLGPLCTCCRVVAIIASKNAGLGGIGSPGQVVMEGTSYPRGRGFEINSKEAGDGPFNKVILVGLSWKLSGELIVLKALKSGFESHHNNLTFS